MKVLYIGHYRDIPSGWGVSAKEYILALDAAGINVVPRPIRLSQNRKTSIPERIEELEQNCASNADAVIMQTLPHLYDKVGAIPHVGMLCTETTNFKASSWPQRCRMMDKIWVMNNQSADSVNVSSNIPYDNIDVIPCPTDMSKFEQSYEPLEIPEIQNTFNFYFVGESVRRKNLGALIKAFHSEFEVSEPVNLVLKTNISGATSEQALENTRNFINGIKEGLKIRPVDKYKKEVVITDHLTDEILMRLHKTCHCFVAPCFGEAWCIPAFDAMGLGNPVIATDCTAFKDYLGDVNREHQAGVLIPAQQTPVFGMNNTFGDLYTGKEEWWDIDISKLKSEMRHMYENSAFYSTLSENGRKQAYDFSYEKIGQQMKNILETIV